jgi:hypothetical protein
MQGNRQFDHAEPGTQMTAGDCDRVDGLGTQFIGDLPKLTFVKLPEVVGSSDLVKQGRL